MSDKKTPW